MQHPLIANRPQSEYFHANNDEVGSHLPVSRSEMPELKYIQYFFCSKFCLFWSYFKDSRMAVDQSC